MSRPACDEPIGTVRFDSGEGIFLLKTKQDTWVSYRRMFEHCTNEDVTGDVIGSI